MYRILDRLLPDPLGIAGSVMEKIRGTQILPVLNELRRTDKISRDELSELRDTKLRKLMAHIQTNSPWYVDHWSAEGISPRDVRTVDDLAKLPILKKDDLRIGMRNGLVAKNIAKMSTDPVASGGTTGDPVRLLISRESRNWAGASMLRYFEWWGRKLGERMGILWGRQDPYGLSAVYKLRRKLTRLLTRRLYMNTFYLDDNILESHYRRLARYDPFILRGYANSIYLMALFIRKQNMPLWPSLRFISSTSERLTQEMRNVIEDVFNVPVANQYASGEVQGVAYECPEGREMHIAEEHVILEVVDEDGNPTMDKAGRILLTDLDNYATPLIRYEVGDLGVVSQNSSCGRAHNILLDIEGRESEALEFDNGRKIGPAYWSVLMRPYSQIEQACIRVISNQSIQVDMVLNEELPKRISDYLSVAIREAVGEGVSIETRHVKHIPRVKSGKMPWVRRIEDEAHGTAE